MFVIENIEQYRKMQEEQAEASRNNDYSKMIMAGDDKSTAMKLFFQNNICGHPDVGTNGGGDYCKICGKTW